MSTPKAPYVSDEGLVTLHRKHRGKPGALLREIRDRYEVRLKEKDELLREAVDRLKGNHTVACLEKGLAPMGAVQRPFPCTCGLDTLLSRINTLNT